jgi:hypothetical protein
MIAALAESTLERCPNLREFHSCASEEEEDLFSLEVEEALWQIISSDEQMNLMTDTS